MLVIGFFIVYYIDNNEGTNGKKLTKAEMMKVHNLTHSQVARIIFLERIPNESERAGQRSMTGVYDYDLFLAGLAKRKPAPLAARASVLYQKSWNGLPMKKLF